MPGFDPGALCTGGSLRHSHAANLLAIDELFASYTKMRETANSNTAMLNMQIIFSAPRCCSGGPARGKLLDN